MPRVAVSGEPIDFRVFGENIRTERKLQSWTVRSLAEAAKVSPDTIVRLEKGMPSTLGTRLRVADALQASYRRLVMSSGESGSGYAIHRRDDDRWSVHYEQRSYRIPEDEEERIQRSDERERLGKLGFVRHFVRMLNCRLPSGKLVAGVLELYGQGEKDNYPAGEVLVYVLSGRVRVVCGENHFVLTAGEATTIRCGGDDFCFEPASSTLPRPPSLLYVRLDERPRTRAKGQAPVRTAS